MEDSIQISLFDKTGLESKLDDPSGSTQKEIQRGYWERIARIALPRFPTFQSKTEKGKDINKRLKALRKAGFSVENYSDMSSPERWNLLMSYRPTIYREAGKYCPEIVMEIKRQNEGQRYTPESAYLLR